MKNAPKEEPTRDDLLELLEAAYQEFKVWMEKIAEKHYSVLNKRLVPQLVRELRDNIKKIINSSNTNGHIVITNEQINQICQKIPLELTRFKRTMRSGRIDTIPGHGIKIQEKLESLLNDSRNKMHPVLPSDLPKLPFENNPEPLNEKEKTFIILYCKELSFDKEELSQLLSAPGDLADLVLKLNLKNYEGYHVRDEELIFDEVQTLIEKNF